MQIEAIELFEMHIDKLIPALDRETKWVVAVSKLLGDIGKIKEYPEYTPMIKNLLDHIAQSDGNFAPEEKIMKEKIIDSIS
jgi:tellurite resistance protein